MALDKSSIAIRTSGLEFSSYSETGNPKRRGGNFPIVRKIFDPYQTIAAQKFAKNICKKNTNWGGKIEGVG